MSKQPFIYNLLVSPRFRILRHILLILAFSIMSVNQVLFNSNDPFTPYSHWILTICAILLSYLVCIYVGIYVFIPKYFLTGKYLKFGLSIIGAIIVFMVIQFTLEILIFDRYHKLDAFILVDILSSLFINLLSFGGITIPIFLKYWLISNQRVNQLEKKHISSEIEQLKEQMNPAFLFSILNTTSQLVKAEPRKASEMLMKLSELLRYQLYDCNRDKVLLQSETTFLTNFLKLEQLYLPHFKYTIQVKGDDKHYFIPPLLLFPFVQIAAKSLDREKEGSVEIQIDADKEKIQMNIKIKGNIEIDHNDKELINIKERLSFLYENSDLYISDSKMDTSEINLKLTNQL